MDKKEIGDKGEFLASEFLINKGYRILDKNFRTRLGEIDIIAKDKDELVFVEVKARRTSYFGSPEEFVTPQKQQRIKRAALEYLSQNPHSSWRIDVISIVTEPETKIEHFQNITS